MMTLYMMEKMNIDEQVFHDKNGYVNAVKKGIQSHKYRIVYRDLWKSVNDIDGDVTVKREYAVQKRVRWFLFFHHWVYAEPINYYGQTVWHNSIHPCYSYIYEQMENGEEPKVFVSNVIPEE